MCLTLQNTTVHNCFVYTNDMQNCIEYSNNNYFFYKALNAHIPQHLTGDCNSFVYKIHACYQGC